VPPGLLKTPFRFEIPGCALGTADLSGWKISIRNSIVTV
jgi:hypothetical protein